VAAVIDDIFSQKISIPDLSKRFETAL